jgi:hypothetical protein
MDAWDFEQPYCHVVHKLVTVMTAVTVSPLCTFDPVALPRSKRIQHLLPHPPSLYILSHNPPCCPPTDPCSPCQDPQLPDVTQTAGLWLLVQMTPPPPKISAEAQHLSRHSTYHNHG